MCLAIPGRVSKIEGRKVYVTYPFEEREALAGIDSLQVGDFVLVQMGIVIKVLSFEEAQLAQEAWQLLPDS